VEAVTLRWHAVALVSTAAACAAAVLVPELILRLPLQCLLVRLTGLKCPFCGMTRDFVGMLHGRFPGHNPFSAATAVVWVGYPASVFRAWRNGTTLVCPDIVRQLVGPVMLLMMIVNNLT
jgi:Protein of unknown function (DUF2752)